MMVLRFKRLMVEAIAPTKKHAEDAGWDLCTPVGFRLEPGERRTVGTGLVVWFEADSGGFGPGLWYYTRLAEKSGLALKRGIALLGGVVDSLYCGPTDEVKVVLLNTDRSAAVSIGIGEAICQAIPTIIPCTEFEAVEWHGQIEGPSRGGFGSG